MSAMQRRKGASAERELAKLLADHLGADITRNLDQTRDGGHDLLGVAGFALEVKRQEQLSLGTWWRQACGQAGRAGLIPCLAYRQSRQPWKFVVPLAVLMGEPIDSKAIATLDMAGFIDVVRLLAPKDSRDAQESADTAPPGTNATDPLPTGGYPANTPLNGVNGETKQ